MTSLKWFHVAKIVSTFFINISKRIDIHGKLPSIFRKEMSSPLRLSFRAPGFSLLEMVVVAAVVGVLLLLLLPVVSRLRSSGDQALCANNLRQIVTAYLTKIADNGGRFPPSRQAKEYDPATGGSRLPKNAFMHLMLSDYIPDPAPALRQPGAMPRDAGVYWCPGRDAATASVVGSEDSAPGTQGAIYSYAHNTQLGGPGASSTLSWLGPNGGGQPNPDYHPALASLAAVSRPSKIIAFTEQANPGNSSAGHLLSSSWPFLKNPSPTPPASGRQLDFTRHAGKVNAAFLDGSVRPMTFDDLAGTRDEFLLP